MFAILTAFTKYFGILKVFSFEKNIIVIVKQGKLEN